MKKYILLLMLVLIIGLILPNCGAIEADLPEKDKFVVSLAGYESGYSWGYGNPVDMKVYWVTPDKYKPFHREYFIPKGYRTLDDFANAKCSDGKPFNNKQKMQALNIWNWMFYAGYYDGVQDKLDGKPYKFTR